MRDVIPSGSNQYLAALSGKQCLESLLMLRQPQIMSDQHVRIDLYKFSVLKRETSDGETLFYSGSE